MEIKAGDVLYTEEDYYKLPDGKRAELINGVFYDMAAPSLVHQRILANLTIDIGRYIRSRGGDCEVFPAPFAVKLMGDDKTIVEPDISVICDKDKLTDKGCEGAPDWIIEILSPSNYIHEIKFKLDLYMNAGVREYWMINPEDSTVMVYRKLDDDYLCHRYTFEDNIRVGIYEGLELKVRAE